MGVEGSLRLQLRTSHVVEPRRSGSDELARLRHELEVAHHQVMDLRLELQRASVERRVLSRELAAYRSSKVHRVAARLVHGLRIGTQRGARAHPTTERPPHPLFDEAFYLTSYPDVLAAGVDAWAHYDRDGWQQGRDPNPLFDSDWYMAAYRSELPPGDNPLVDYWHRGWREGRNPSPWFDTGWYLNAYPDVRLAGINPLLHFLASGAEEGRKPSYRFSPRLYTSSLATHTPVRRDSAVTDFLRRRGASFLGECKSRVRTQRQVELESFLDREQRLDLRSEQAAVTVVVVVWNQAAFTLACLQSIAQSSVSAEVLVVDNASSDETADLLDRVVGVRVIRNDDNVGFVRAVNQAFAEVATPFVVLLNNDATVDSEALERACAMLGDPTVGAVGGRVILPNGLLQEAGSYLDSSAIAHGYLRNEPPWSGDAMYRRPVDFCSGVFLAFRPTRARAGRPGRRFRARVWRRGGLVHADLVQRATGSLRPEHRDPPPRIRIFGRFQRTSSSDGTEPVPLGSQIPECARPIVRPGSVTLTGWLRCAYRGPGSSSSRTESHTSTRERGSPDSRVLRSLVSLGCFVTLLPMYSGEVVDWASSWREFGPRCASFLRSRSRESRTTYSATPTSST